jgi:hypothetical protein
MLDKLRSNDRGQMGGNDLPGVALVIMIAGVVLFVGIQIMSQVIEQTALQSDDPLYNASQSVQDGLNSAFSMFGILFLVVILSVVIVYLYGLRGR